MSVRTPLDEQPLVEGGATPWAEASERLMTPEHDRTYWLATNGPDGRPHLRPLLGLWLDDSFFFIAGVATRKGKNLQADPRCVIGASSQILPALDVVLEGAAVRVTDDEKLQRVADAYSSMLHWALEVRDGAIVGPNALTAGPPPYAVFEVAPSTVVGLPGIAGTEEGKGPAGSFSPTRWRF